MVELLPFFFDLSGFEVFRHEQEAHLVLHRPGRIIQFSQCEVAFILFVDTYLLTFPLDTNLLGLVRINFKAIIESAPFDRFVHLRVAYTVVSHVNS